ncbi:hypothetical protein [Paenibacillus caui]|uniref:hypothetical protein n=1 Tax=Paenibacillus caui TaxID=2873927 RepID=UPI001F2D8DAD|nr:hypothetical protein [Paenibacillus caui]
MVRVLLIPQLERSKDKTEEGSLFWVDKNELGSLSLANGLKVRLPMFFDKKYSEGFGVWNENNKSELKWQ